MGDDWHVRGSWVLLEPDCYVKTVDSWKIQIHDDLIWVESHCLLYGLLTVCGLNIKPRISREST